MKVRNIIHRALLSATALFIASTASFAEESNLVVNWDGNGSADSPYLIKNANDLAAIAYYTEKGVSFANVYFKMTANIDLSAYDNWTPIGTIDYHFEGVFDGGGKTISSLKINAAENNRLGLFGNIKNATIRNLTIDAGSSITGGDWVGAFAAYCDRGCVLSNLTNKASVNGVECVGGIVGNTNGTNSFLNCSNYGKIVSIYKDEARKLSFVGGIVGYIHNGVVDGCSNFGDVSGNGHRVAGLIAWGAGKEGSTKLVISNCTNNGNVTGTNSDDLAGVVALLGAVGKEDWRHANIKVYNCTNNGTVKLADSSEKGIHVGGVVAHPAEDGYVFEKCVNNGSVTTKFGYVGGVIGDGMAMQIRDCINTGAVTSGDYESHDEHPECGGIVGGMNGDGGNSFIINCKNSGQISSNGYLVGGIIGFYTNSQGPNSTLVSPICYIEGCTNTGNVTASGYNPATDCETQCNIGGIMGHGPALVIGCKNSGTVSGLQGNIGGIVGALGGIVNCCNEGDIHGLSASGTKAVGGLLGVNWARCNTFLGVYNSYSRGHIYLHSTTEPGKRTGGLLVGECTTTVINCYTDGDIHFTESADLHHGIFNETYAYKRDFEGYEEVYGYRDNAFAKGVDMSTILYDVSPNNGWGVGFFEKKENVYDTGPDGTLQTRLQNYVSVIMPSQTLWERDIPFETWCLSSTANTSGVYYPIFGDPTSGTPEVPGYIEPEVVNYSISYNLNATGTPTGISAPSQQSGSQSYTVSDIVSEGVYSYVSGNVKYSFAGWNTKEDGTGDSYVAGSMITPSANTTLYGMWTAGFQVRYALATGLDADDFESLTLPFDPTWYGANAEVTVQMPGAGDFSPKVFDFWSTEPDGSGDRYGTAYISENQNKFNITKDMVLYANVHDVVFQKIVIERTGLKAGENAVYTVEGPESSFVVALEGREESGAPVKVSTTITKVPTGDYTVTETGWNWAYNKDEVDVQPESQKKSATQGTATATMDDNRTLTFTFSGDIKDETPKHGENVKGTK